MFRRGFASADDHDVCGRGDGHVRANEIDLRLWDRERTIDSYLLRTNRDAYLRRGKYIRDWQAQDFNVVAVQN